MWKPVMSFWLLIVCGCSEHGLVAYELEEGLEGIEPWRPDLPDLPDPDTDTDPDPDPDPPPNTIENCDNPGAVSRWAEGEVWVVSNSTSSAKRTKTGTLDVSDTGRFDVYSRYSAESGSVQANESAFYRIANETSVDGLPVLGNCGDEWVVEDLDNESAWPEDAYIYIGTFDLEEGYNQLTFSHYCMLYEVGECPEFHVDWIDSTCDSDNPNSAHFNGDLCLLTSEQ